MLLLDKPTGPSSKAVLQHAKRLLEARSAGHTGTLDPMASGLLVLCFGEATKFSGAMLDADKTYRARVRLGVRTSTGDAEGEPLESREPDVSREQLDSTLQRFRGAIDQIPPMHSAIKHRGRPLYSYAREGETIERAPRKVVIRELDLERREGNDLYLRIAFSNGTYVRTLAEDIGAALGCGAHLAALQRTAVGPFTLDEAVTLDTLEALPGDARRERLLPMETLVASRPRVMLDSAASSRFCQGQRIGTHAEQGAVAVFGSDVRFLGIGEADADGVLQPKRLVQIRDAGAGREPLVEDTDLKIK